MRSRQRIDKRVDERMEVLKSEQNIINLNDHIIYDISIKHVDLSKNNIAYIPDEFGNLLNLKSLNLSKNRLDEKSFPQVLSRLQMLEELNLSD